MIRLNKHIKGMGICSRRKADEFIAKGYIKVNGKIVTDLGFKINPEKDLVAVLPALDQEVSEFSYILLNKPKGYVCSKSNMEGNNIFRLLPKIDNLTYAGRLDKDSHGLILLSNDGKFIYKIASSEFAKEKEYIVRVNKEITDNFLYKQSDGSIKLDGRLVKRTYVELVNSYTYKIVLQEGINRQIRRMAEHQGYKVVDLKRIRIGNLVDNELNCGSWRDLTIKEIKNLSIIHSQSV